MCKSGTVLPKENFSVDFYYTSLLGQSCFGSRDPLEGSVKSKAVHEKDNDTWADCGPNLKLEP